MARSRILQNERGGWYERTREKMLAAGELPCAFRRQILEQNLLWPECMN